MTVPIRKAAIYAIFQVTKQISGIINKTTILVERCIMNTTINYLGQRLVQLRKKNNLSQRALGNMVGVSQQAIDKIESGITQHPRKIHALAKCLNTTAGYLIDGHESPDMLTNSNRLDNAKARPPIFDTLAKNLPVIGRAQGGADGDLILDNNPIDWTFRPPQLSGIQDAFAVYITGDSMAPKYKDGDLAYVHPNRPVTKGRYALIETKDHRGLIKQFMRWQDDTLVIWQHNPAFEIVIPKKKVLNVMLVIGSIDS